jgi:hypothetical protein
MICHMGATTAVAGAAGQAFAVWMPLDSFAPITFAAAATAAGPTAVQPIVCGALAPRASASSNPEFYAVIASFLRRTIGTGDFGASRLHVVSLPYAEDCTKSLMSCLASLYSETHRECSPFEFAAKHLVDVDALLVRTCAVVRRHRHTLRRLIVPILRQAGVPAFADALAECTAITSLDVSRAAFPFRSWQQLGPTLQTLKLNEIRGGGTDTTFRVLADSMPALRELELFIRGQPSQDGFIELVSRLRSLNVYASVSPWDLLHDDGAWPLTLPNLEELTWVASFGAGTVAVAILRRAVSLRAAHVLHAIALAATAAGPVASVATGITPHVSQCTRAPLSNVKSLTIAAVVDDPTSLVKILAASPRASAVRLRWDGSGPGLLGLLHAAASAASTSAGWRRVRRVHIDVYFIVRPHPEVARCVRALFPRARYASWGTNGLSEVVQRARYASWGTNGMSEVVQLLSEVA